MPKSILITGGAGFVGSSLARSFRKVHPEARIVCFDNLRRRGSELNLSIFRETGIEFAHGDIRQPHDLEDLTGDFELVIEASAEPSVLSGLTGSPSYLIDTNLGGTLHCLDFARRRAERLVFLSTSRVYSLDALRGIDLVEAPTRFEVAPTQRLAGVDQGGIAETFPTDTARSLYGATKLASEMFVQEYAAAYGLKALVNRCGVIAGPGQFGRVDQGVFTLWVAHHVFGKPLRYTGFGGTGLQVRDLLHPADLFDLIERQIRSDRGWEGDIFNVGGGIGCSTSMHELTELCRRATNAEVPVARDPAQNRVDVPFYVSNNAKARSLFGWQPTYTAAKIVEDITRWIRANEATLRPIFC